MKPEMTERERKLVEKVQATIAREMKVDTNDRKYFEEGEDHLRDFYNLAMQAATIVKEHPMDKVSSVIKNIGKEVKKVGDCFSANRLGFAFEEALKNSDIDPLGREWTQNPFANIAFD